MGTVSFPECPERMAVHHPGGGGGGGGGRKTKRWTMADRKRNSSILARDSPRHTRLPGDTENSPWYTSNKLHTRPPADKENNPWYTSDKLHTHRHSDTENSPWYTFIATGAVIVQELCESRGDRPGLSILASLLVSVDVKLY